MWWKVLPKKRRTYKPANVSYLEKWLHALCFCGLLLIVCTTVGLTGCNRWSNYQQIKVTQVYDGDTILLENGEKVRLIGIDCPEAHDSDKLISDARRTGEGIESIKEKGRYAKNFTQSILEGQTVRLEFDAQRHDQYGRLLAYVWMEVDPSSALGQAVGSYIDLPPPTETPRLEKAQLLVNELILRMGHARPMPIAPNTKYADHFQQLYQQSKGRWN
jgi:micrococcal nuclease